LSFLLPFILSSGPSIALFEILHVALLEYFPFIILLLSLFTVTGGIKISGSFSGSPRFNTGLLAIGTILASWMGTTGAAMALIRPLLRANAWRRYRTHVVVFFIFLVANVGGSLTPLGDPPLFLGFLKGVDFFWTTTHMLLPMAFLATVLLLIFYFLDSFLAHRDGARPEINEEATKFGVEGRINILLLFGVIGAVLMSGVWRPGVSFGVYYVDVELQNLTRDLLLLLITVLSWLVTPREIRTGNDFSWFPIVEVAKLFAGIFITIVPVIAILRAGHGGALSVVHRAVSAEDGTPINAMYFWITGILSSFLDNAPTYLVFFNTAGGDAELLMGPLETTLLAISAGAVFMGANTYIGNAPNFMVRAIAEESGVKMPSFFGYMVWSIALLMPIFVVVTLIWFL
ncbi:MAG: sodium:proton antiporter, partial [Pseudomonadota bacterium]